MDSIIVGLDERSYPILFGQDILSQCGDYFQDYKVPMSVALVTNQTVGRFYAEKIIDALRSVGSNVSKIIIPDGESFKSNATLCNIYDGLIAAGIDRGGAIIALGGGVVGDIAGFAAATYLRGIPFVQVPTTLLAQVDSSVGGKTGINLEQGKNLVGAFYQPSLVVIDLSTLKTLPEREYLSGLAEVIKYGVVFDKELFAELEASINQILARDTECLLPIIKRCCQLKAAVVEEDEREVGIRRVLNFGHTFGHVIENLAGYGAYLHGEAVAIGMVMASRYSCAQGYCSATETERIVSLLARLGLPVSWPEFAGETVIRLLQRDKKVRDAGLSFICNRGIGNFHIERITNLAALLGSCEIGG